MVGRLHCRLFRTAQLTDWCSIGKGQNVDQEAGFSASTRRFEGAVDPQSRLADYGDFLMPLSVVYPEQQKIGRQDPIALIGRGMSAKDAQQKMQRAGRERDRGRRTKKGDALEGGLQWVSIRVDSIPNWTHADCTCSSS